MFKTPSASEKIEEVENKVILNPYDSIETAHGWIKAKELKLEDKIVEEETRTPLTIESISTKNNYFIVKFMEK